MKALYTAEALATGDGRNGHVRSSDGLLDFDLAIPVAMGGTGGGTNPEQLFAAGYAACFHSALQVVARQAKANVADSAVGARVGIGSLDGGGFGLEVTLEGRPAATSTRPRPRSWSRRPTRSARTRTPPAATSTSTRS